MLFRDARKELRMGRTNKGIALLEECLSLDATDSHSWLALARAEAWRGNGNVARSLFQNGTKACPDNVHLWQAWAVHDLGSPRIARKKQARTTAAA